MDLNAEQFVDRLLTKEALETPSDKVKPEEVDIQLPPWFDEKKFKQAQRFFFQHCYSFSTSMLLGLVAVLSVPSILKVLVASRRSTSIYTAYRRYLSTLLHVQSWFEHELKPGSISWKSLHAVRTRHVRAGLASKLKGGDIVSQRDIALTMFGFVGFSMLKPDKLGIRQLTPGDWEAYNHFWKVIGYMIGLEDRYNICRDTYDETCKVLQLILDRVYTPCLENVPEYFEHMATVMLDGMWSVNYSININSILYVTRALADVPGYVYTEKERVDMQRRLKDQLKEKPLDIGVDTNSLMCKSAVEGLPKREPRLLYVRDFDTVETVPAFKRLDFWAKFNLALGSVAMVWYTTFLGRWYFNLNFLWSLFLMKYFPYIAFIRFGIKKSIVNIFVEDPMDNTMPKINAEYYKQPPVETWYSSWKSKIW